MRYLAVRRRRGVCPNDFKELSKLQETASRSREEYNLERYISTRTRFEFLGRVALVNDSRHCTSTWQPFDPVAQLVVTSTVCCYGHHVTTPH